MELSSKDASLKMLPEKRQPAVINNTSFYFKAKPRIGSQLQAHTTDPQYIKVYTSEPSEKYKDNNFAFCRCDNVTTIWCNQLQYSYCTKPADMEDFHFIERNQFGLFEVTDVVHQKVLRIKEFVGELNNLLNNGEDFRNLKELTRNEINYRLKTYMFIYLASLLALLCTNIFILIDMLITVTILVILGSLGVVISLFLVFNEKKFDKLLFFKQIDLGKKQADKADLMFKKWNQTHFWLMNAKVSTTMAMTYVLVILDRQSTFEVENHRYPFGNDLDKPSRRKLSI